MFKKAKKTKNENAHISQNETASEGTLENEQISLDVTENGTEAAAVTTITLSLTSFRPEINVKVMNVDHPFLFFITDNKSDNVLFAGKIMNL